MKKVILFCLMYHFGLAWSTCHLIAEKQEVFEKDLKQTMLSEMGQAELDAIWSEDLSCHLILDLIAGDDEARPLFDKMIDVMIKHKISPKQLESYAFTDTSTGETISTVRRILDSSNLKNLDVMQRRLQTLKSHGVSIDHESLSTYRFNLSQENMKDTYNACREFKGDFYYCLEVAADSFVKANYDKIKKNGYGLASEMIENLKSELKLVGVLEEQAIAFIVSYAQDSAKLFLGTPLKVAATQRLDLNLVKVLLQSGADASELFYIRKLLLDDVIIARATSYSNDSALRALKVEKRDEVLRFIDTLVLADNSESAK